MTIPASPHVQSQQAVEGNRPVVCTHAGSPGNWETDWLSLQGAAADIITGTTDADLLTLVPYASTPLYGFTAEIVQSNGVLQPPGNTTPGYEYNLYYFPTSGQFEMSNVGAQLQSRPYRVIVYKLASALAPEFGYLRCSGSFSLANNSYFGGTWTVDASAGLDVNTVAPAPSNRAGFILKAGKTYELSCSIHIFHGTGNLFAFFSWWNRDTGTVLPLVTSGGVTYDSANNGSIHEYGYCSARFTPAVDTEVNVRSGQVSGSITVAGESQDRGSGIWCREVK